VVPRMTLRYPSLNPVVEHFGTNYELNSGKGTITSYFGLMVGYHNVPLDSTGFRLVFCIHVRLSDTFNTEYYEPIGLGLLLRDLIGCIRRELKIRNFGGKTATIGRSAKQMSVVTVYLNVALSKNDRFTPLVLRVSEV